MSPLLKDRRQCCVLRRVHEEGTFSHAARRAAQGGREQEVGAEPCCVQLWSVERPMFLFWGMRQSHGQDGKVSDPVGLCSSPEVGFKMSINK